MLIAASMVVYPVQQGYAQTGDAALAEASVIPLRSDVKLSDGRRMSFLEWGSPAKPVLLLLHGKGSSAAENSLFAAALARDFHVYAADFRGCGFSDWARDGDYTVEASVADLEQLVSALRLGRFAVYGHSLGAVVGIAYAANNPGHVAALMLEDGGPTSLSDGSRPPLNPGQTAYAGAPSAMPEQRSFASWDEMVAAQPARPRGVPTPLILESRFVRRPDGTVRERNDVLGLWKTERGEAFVHPWPLVRMLAMPTLLIRADHGLVPEAIAREMAAANPNVRFVDVRDSGHGVHFDQPDQVLAVVREFSKSQALSNFR